MRLLNPRKSAVFIFGRWLRSCNGMHLCLLVGEHQQHMRTFSRLLLVRIIPYQRDLRADSPSWSVVTDLLC